MLSQSVLALYLARYFYPEITKLKDLCTFEGYPEITKLKDLCKFEGFLANYLVSVQLLLTLAGSILGSAKTNHLVQV